MKKRISLFILLIIGATSADWASLYSFSSNIRIPVLQKYPFILPYKSKSGQDNRSPYFTDEYKYAHIKLANGRFFEGVKMRIDLAAQQTFFFASNGVEISIDPGQVKEINYADTTTGGIIFYKFQTGFPVIDRQNKNNFYLVLADGRCKFLKCIIKKAVDAKKIVLSEIADEYEVYEDYYLFVNGSIKKLKKDKEWILATLSDKPEEMNTYIQTHKIIFRNVEQLTQLFTFYNSL